MKTQTIKIDKEELDDLNSVIKGESGIVGEHTVARFTANFGNGIEADIKVCGVKESQDSEEDQCTPYVDAVLFEDGSEVCLIEPAFETLNGEYLFEYNGETYQVIVSS